MGGASTTRTVPRGGGANKGPVGSRTGQRLSGIAVALGLVLFLGRSE
ncbi:signal peptidase I, partial [Streptomyces violaceoruber]